MVFLYKVELAKMAPNSVNTHLKYVNLMLLKDKKIYFREKWLIFFGGIAGEAELILGIWGAKAKYLQGFGKINALLLGSKDTPGGINC